MRLDKENYRKQQSASSPKGVFVFRGIAKEMIAKNGAETHVEKLVGAPGDNVLRADGIRNAFDAQDVGKGDAKIAALPVAGLLRDKVGDKTANAFFADDFVVKKERDDFPDFWIVEVVVAVVVIKDVFQPAVVQDGPVVVLIDVVDDGVSGFGAVNQHHHALHGGSLVSKERPQLLHGVVPGVAMGM